MVSRVNKNIAKVESFDTYIKNRPGGAAGILPEGMAELGQGDDLITDLMNQGQAFEAESGSMDFEEKMNAFKALMDKVNTAFAQRVDQMVDKAAGNPRFKN